jgi:hypothetical protein
MTIGQIIIIIIIIIDNDNIIIIIIIIGIKGIIISCSIFVCKLLRFVFF